MNFAVHQEKEKNHKTKSAKKEAEKEKRRVIDFKEAACCSSAVVHGAAWRKKEYVRGISGITKTLGKAKSHFESTQTGSGTVLPRLGGF